MKFGMTATCEWLDFCLAQKQNNELFQNAVVVIKTSLVPH